MKNSKIKIIGLIVAVALATALFIFYKLPESAELDIVSTHTIIPQNSTERILTKEIGEPSSIFSVKFKEPRTMKFFNNQIFVVEISDMTLKRISMDGSLINSIGDKVGISQVGINFLSDYTIVGENVWLLDHRSRQIYHFNLIGEFLESIPVEKSFLRISSMDSSLVLMNLFSENLFEIFSYSGHRKESFGSLVSDQTDSPLSLSGSLFIEADVLYFLPRYASYIVKFSSKKSQTFLELIDKMPFPRSKVLHNISGQVRFFAPSQNLITHEMSIFNDRAFVHTQIQKGTEFESWIDEYVLESGQYLQSFKLPSRVKSALVKNNMIYTLNDTSITVYEVPK